MEHEPQSLEGRLREVINQFSAESGSDTPDFILAQYLLGCLNNFDKAVRQREKWYGRKAIIPLGKPDFRCIYMSGERDAFSERRGQLKVWLARVLSEWELSSALPGETADAIVSKLETCFPISERTLSRPLPNPSELVRTLESQPA